MAYFGGHGSFLILGLSNTPGIVGLSTVPSEKRWCDSTSFGDFAEGGFHKAELSVDYSCLYLLHRDVVIRDDVKWIFNGEIRLLDGSEGQSRRFRFYYYNVSNGYMSHPVYFDYRGNNNSDSFHVQFVGTTKFYRPGDYLLRIDDLLIDSNITFYGYGRVMVYDETFRMIEDFQNMAIGYSEIILTLIILLIVISAWTSLGVVVSWVDLKYEWKAFWKSNYAIVFSFFLMTFFFDILTTMVGLFHGAWEVNDFFRVDMLGATWAAILFMAGIGFLVFYFRDKNIVKLLGREYPASWLGYSIGFGVAGLVRFYIVGNNLWVVNLVGGPELFVGTMIVILGCIIVFVLWAGRRLFHKRRGLLKW